MEARLPLEPVNVASVDDFAPELHYRRIRLTGGELRLDQSVILARKFYKNLPGFWVMSPYVFADGSAVWVHRGWSREGEGLNDATVPVPGDLELIGLLYHPTRTIEDKLARRAVEEGRFDFSDVPVIGEVDIQLLEQAAGHRAPNRELLVVLGPDIAKQWPDARPTPTDEHITKPYLTPMTHFGYAVLWYGAALLLCWIFWAGWTGRLAPSRKPRG